MKQNIVNVNAIEETLKVSRSTAGVGVDQGAFSAFSAWGARVADGLTQN
jgi:hypothetical protein